jgi:hypothetical protein
MRVADYIAQACVDAGIKEVNPKIGNPGFKNPGGLHVQDYAPNNTGLIKEKGIKIEMLSGDFLGLLQGMNPDKDIIGKPIGKLAHLGAIAPN